MFVPGGLALPATLLFYAGVTSARICTSITTPTGTASQHCTNAGGSPLWEQIAWPVGLLALTAAAIAAAVHLARSSR